MLVAEVEGEEARGRNGLEVGEEKMCGGRECGRVRDDGPTVVVRVRVG